MTPVFHTCKLKENNYTCFALFMTLILVSNSTIKMLIINSSKGDLHSYGNEIVHCKSLMNILSGAPDYTLFFYGTKDRKFMMP